MEEEEETGGKGKERKEQGKRRDRETEYFNGKPLLSSRLKLRNIIHIPLCLWIKHRQTDTHTHTHTQPTRMHRCTYLNTHVHTHIHTPKNVLSSPNK